MIQFKKIGMGGGYEIKIDSRKDLLDLMQYLVNVETNEPVEILHNESVYKLIVQLTETSDNIKFDDKKREIIFDLEKEDLDIWLYRLEVSLVDECFYPAELFEFKLKRKIIYTYMTVSFT